MTATHPDSQREDVLYTASYDPDHDPSISVVIIDGVAAVQACDPLDLVPLHSTVDLELIEALYCPTFLDCDHADGVITFPVGDYWVRVRGDRTVEIFHSRSGLTETGTNCIHIPTRGE